MNYLNNLENKIEALAEPTNDEEKFIVVDKAKEERWREKRQGKITSSTLPDLMKFGRKKEELWGETAKKVLYPIKYERRTKVIRRQMDIFNFRWGRDNEPLAIAWLRKNKYKIQSSDDFDDIIFNTPFKGFGDSPDFVGEDLVGEIICPVDQSKIEELLDVDVVDKKNEKYYQFIGHFIGEPKAKKLLYVVYDAYVDDAHVIELDRKDYEDDIELVTQRIKDANEFLNEVMEGEWKISQINEYFNN